MGCFRRQLLSQSALARTGSPVIIVIMASAKYLETPGPAGEKKYDVFISHCKRIGTTEDRALWVQDTLEEAGQTSFFDRSSLDEISKAQLERDVIASRCLVTILDPETFTSEWVVFENETATAAGVPIVPFYDGDAYAWSELQQWKDKYPSFFAKVAPIEYRKAEHKESRRKLVETTKRMRDGVFDADGRRRRHASKFHASKFHASHLRACKPSPCHPFMPSRSPSFHLPQLQRGRRRREG